MAISGTNSIVFARHRMNNRRWNHFVGGRWTGSFDSAVGITTEYAYQPSTNYISSETIKNSAGVTLASYAYTDRSDGLKTSETDTTLNSDGTTYDTRTLTRSYGGLGRLTQEKSVDAGNPGAPGNYTDNYSCDLNSNRVSETEDQGNTGSTTDTVTSTYPGAAAHPRPGASAGFRGAEHYFPPACRAAPLNADDELTQAVDANTGTTVYTYDNNGSQIETQHTPSRGTSPDTTTTNEYDLQGQMAGTQTTNSSGTTKATYEYDDSGNRIVETNTNTAGTTTTTYYLADSESPTGYPQTIEQGAAPDQPQITYVWGKTLISETYATGATIPGVGTAASPTTYYILTDAHGSTRLITDATGVVVQRLNYDAFGNALGFSTTTALTTQLYDSMSFDPASGNYDDGARFYNTASGEFTQADYGNYGTLNDPMSYLPYTFTGGDPVSMVDLSGHFTLAGTISALSDLAMLVAVRLAPYAGALNTAQLVAGTATFVSFAADPQAAQQFIATGGNPIDLVDSLVAVAGSAGVSDVVLMGNSLLDDAKALQLEGAAEYKPLMGYVNQASGELFQQQVLENLGAVENQMSYAAGGANVRPDFQAGTRYGIADVKNVVSITNTAQIRGFTALATKDNLPFSLIISPNTDYIAGPVVQAINDSGGTVWEFNPSNNMWSPIDISGFGRNNPWKR